MPHKEKEKAKEDYKKKGGMFKRKNVRQSFLFLAFRSKTEGQQENMSTSPLHSMLLVAALLPVGNQCLTHRKRDHRYSHCGHASITYREYSLHWVIWS